MALYDYKNPTTGEVRTKQFPLVDDKPAVIIEDGTTYERVFYPLNVVYACMGFYNTDNRDSIETWRKENMKGL